jgi:WD40 repeat protein
MMNVRRDLVAGMSAVSLLVLSCDGPSVASRLAKAPTYDPTNQSKCAVAASHAKPLVVEWPSADRGELEAVRGRGLVVVRYAGCEMKLLDRCTANVKYAYSPINRKKDRVVMRDTDDLYANVPVGAAGLEATLKKTGELDVDMTMVGRWESERTSLRRDELSGECEGATHVLSAITVGAFTFTAGADAEVGAKASLLGAGGGARSTAKRETLATDGSENACDKATTGDRAPPDECGAMLRVEVTALSAVAPPVAGAGSGRADSGHVATLALGTIGVASVAFSRDSARLAVGYANGPSWAGEIALRDATTGESQGSLPAGGETAHVVATADGRHWLTCTSKGAPSAQLWNVVTSAREGPRLPLPDGTTDLINSPDGKLLAMAVRVSPSEHFVALARLTGAVVARLPCETDTRSIAFSPDSSTLAVGAEAPGVATHPGNTITLWDVRTRTKKRVLPGSIGVTSLAFSPDGRLLAAGYNNTGGMAVRLWDPESGRTVGDLAFPRSTPTIQCLEFSPSGKLLATCGGSLHAGGVGLWDVASRTLFAELATESDYVGAVAFSPDGKRLAAGGAKRGRGGLLDLWDLGSLR